MLKIHSTKPTCTLGLLRPFHDGIRPLYKLNACPTQSPDFNHVVSRTNLFSSQVGIIPLFQYNGIWT